MVANWRFVAHTYAAALIAVLACWPAPRAEESGDDAVIDFVDSLICWSPPVVNEMAWPTNQKNVRNPNHHFFSKKYRNTPPICTAVRLVPLCSEEREILSVLLPFVSQYASHLRCSTPPVCIAVLLGKSWWLWSPACSPTKLEKRASHRVKDRQIFNHIYTTRIPMEFEYSAWFTHILACLLPEFNMHILPLPAPYVHQAERQCLPIMKHWHRPSAERSSRKNREIWNEASESEICSEICSQIRPEIRPEMFRAFLAGRKVLPQNFTTFSHRRFQISNRIPNQISQKIHKHTSAGLAAPMKQTSLI